MFDDLREEASSTPQVKQPTPEPVAERIAAPKPRRKQKKILGMTGPQRFALSVMFMLMVCVTGFMFLLVMGKIGL
jgi:hypothetical protein